MFLTEREFIDADWVLVEFLFMVRLTTLAALAWSAGCRFRFIDLLRYFAIASLA